MSENKSAQYSIYLHDTINSLKPLLLAKLYTKNTQLVDNVAQQFRAQYMSEGVLFNSKYIIIKHGRQAIKSIGLYYGANFITTE